MKNNFLTILAAKHSFNTTKFYKEYLKKTKPERALILDIRNEYPEYPTIENNISFINESDRKGIYRVRLFNLSLKELGNIYIRIISEFTHGTLICENPHILFNKLPAELVACICTGRYKERHIIIHFVSLHNALLQNFVSNMDFLILHKTLDSVKQNKKRIPPELYPLFLKAESKLKQKTKVVIDLVNETIIND